MAASNREACIEITLVYEAPNGSKGSGGYTNLAADPGGPTKWGITIFDARLHWKKDATAADVKAMPLSVAYDIYRSKYWAKMNCDDDPAGVDLVTFDYGVNSGTGRAVPLRAKTKQADVVKWVKAYCAARLSFLQGLRTWKTFGKGWGARVTNVEARGVKMALAAKGLPAPEVSKELHKEASGADKKATMHATATTTTVAAPASTQVPDAPHHLDLSAIDPFILGSGVLVIVTVAAYFGWRWYVNHKRAAAYTAVAQEG